jgi:hypothetical protein
VPLRLVASVLGRNGFGRWFAHFERLRRTEEQVVVVGLRSQVRREEVMRGIEAA